MDPLHSDDAQVAKTYRAFRWFGFAVTAVFFGAAIVGHREPAALAATVEATALRPGADPELVRLEAKRLRWATHALLNNLVDDDQQPRWTDLAQHVVCGAGQQVLVNGEPLRIGDRLPAASFQLEFRLDNACPLGADGPRLSGLVQMVVLRDDEEGIVPLIVAPPL